MRQSICVIVKIFLMFDCYCRPAFTISINLKGPKLRLKKLSDTIQTTN